MSFPRARGEGRERGESRDLLRDMQGVLADEADGAAAEAEGTLSSARGRVKPVSGFGERRLGEKTDRPS